MRSIVEMVINSEKEGNFLIPQKYTLQRAMTLTTKIRDKCKAVIKEPKENKNKSK